MVRIEALISIKHILAMHNRRFPAPWSAELQPACFVVIDNFEGEAGRRDPHQSGFGYGSSQLLLKGFGEAHHAGHQVDA
jgi:hypothetical protein